MTTLTTGTNDNINIQKTAFLFLLTMACVPSIFAQADYIASSPDSISEPSILLLEEIRILKLKETCSNRYKMYPTENRYNLLKLDTQTGKIRPIGQLFEVFADYKIQMCQFHMVSIIRRKLTKNPKLKAGKELLELAYMMKDMSKTDFTERFTAWKEKWHDFLKEKTINETTGRTIFTHQRLRSAMMSISHYLPYLFTFEEVPGMPNTNNAIEGTFTDMKKNLRNHPGMTAKNRKRMMDGFFLAYWTALFLAKLLPSRASLCFEP